MTDFTVRIGDIMGKDVQATLAVDESLLQEYNKKMKLDYAVLPADKYSFEKEVIIESGKTMAKPTVVTISLMKLPKEMKYSIAYQSDKRRQCPGRDTGSQLHFIT